MIAQGELVSKSTVLEWGLQIARLAIFNKTLNLKKDHLAMVSKCVERLPIIAVATLGHLPEK